MSASSFVVAIPTRERFVHLMPTLDALACQDRPVSVVVVDQSTELHPTLDRRRREDPLLQVLRHDGHGLSAARNLAWSVVESPWIAFVDDDCRPEPDWARCLEEAIARFPGVAAISGHVLAVDAPEDGDDYLPVTASHVAREAVLTGKRIPPWDIGMGVCMAIRRDVIERIGGWDERLGAGTHPFPAAEDMDFNYRLLRAGEAALVTPTVRATHHQWRKADELPAVYEAYMAGWCGFAMKCLRTGDVRDGLWLWSLGARDLVRMGASAMRRRSWLRARVAGRKLRGMLRGTLLGARTAW